MRYMRVLIAVALIGALESQTPAQEKSPAEFEKKAVTIWSDGTKMAGDLYLPKGLKKEDKLPAIVFCNGTAGTKSGTPARLAPHFVQSGFIFLAFDYRGWGASEGKLTAAQLCDSFGSFE